MSSISWSIPRSPPLEPLNTPEINEFIQAFPGGPREEIIFFGMSFSVKTPALIASSTS